ncbi:MAG: protein kinase [Elusimicrobiota bacterium]
MRRLLFLCALLSACVLSCDAWCDEWCTDFKSSKVCNSKKQLDATAKQREQAEKEKASEREKLARAMEAAKKAWSNQEKRHNEREAERAEQKFEQAKQRLEAYDKKSLEQAKEYVAAEEAYQAETGQVRYPNDYNFWRSRLGYQPEAEEGGSTGMDSGADAARKTLTTPSKGTGGVFEKARKLGKIGDKVMMDNLKFMQDQQPPSAAPQAIPGSQARSEGSRPRTGGLAIDPLKTQVMLSPARNDSLPVVKASKAAYRAQEFANKGEYKTALSVIDKGLASEPGNVDLFKLKAGILNKERRFEEAEEAALQALYLSPDDPEALKSLIWALLHQKKYDEALKYANSLVRIAPEDPEAYLLRAFAYEHLNQRDKMIEDLEMAASLDPRYQGHLQLAKSGATLFDPDDLDSESLMEAIAVAPRKNTVPLVGLGLIFLSVGGAGALFWLKRRKGRSRRSGGPKVGASPAAAPSSEAKSVPAQSPAPESAPQPAQALKPNDVLNGKYKLGRLEYDAPSCRIWTAEDQSLNRPVLVKQIPYPPGQAAQALKAALQKEAQVLAELHHPNIVDLYEVLDLPSGFCWVFEATPGRSVRRMIEKRKFLPWDTAKAVLLNAAEALRFAHEKGILHKNLRLDNLIVTLQGALKVGEFSPSAPPQAMLAPYAAPEGARGQATPASDIYSMGVCFYEALTGALPSQPYVPAGQWVAGLDPKVDSFLKAALEPDPAKRIQSAAEFREQLLKI